MNFLEALNAAVVLVGVPTIASVLLSTGRKLQKLDDLGSAIEEEIKPDLKDVRERFSALEGRMAGYTQSNSPISLTEKGEKLLKESGFKEYIDNNKDRLINLCSQKRGLETAYDIQEAVFDFFDNELKFEPELEKQIKEYAYADGASMETVRRLGGIYFRDNCLEHFNKSAQEIDYPNKNATT
jgi:hypothetical protein